MASQLRWGIPSTAGITKALLFALRGAPRSHLVAVANRDSGRARDCVAARGIPPSTAATRSCWPIRTSTWSTSRCRISGTPRGR